MTTSGSMRMPRATYLPSKLARLSIPATMLTHEEGPSKPISLLIVMPASHATSATAKYAMKALPSPMTLIASMKIARIGAMMSAVE